MYGSEGKVTVGQKTVHTINVTTPIVSNNEVRNEDEIHLIVNGQVIKRMSKWQAERMGIVEASQ